MKNLHYFQNLTPTLFLDHACDVYPDRLAVVSPVIKYTFRELKHRSLEISLTLTELDVVRNDKVGILSENSPDYIACHYGIPAAEAIIVSLNPFLSDVVLCQQINFVEIKVLFVSSKVLRSKRDLISKLSESVSVLILDDDGSSITGRYQLIKRVEVGDSQKKCLSDNFENEMSTIAINFTSGTTGTPKGVEYSHRAAYLHGLGQVDMLGISSKSRYLWSLPMFHVNGWGHMWAAVAAGAVQYVDNLGASPIEGDLSMAIEDYEITHLAGAPRLLETVNVEEMKGIVRRNLTFMTGGAAPSKALIKNAQIFGIKFIHQYGLNETCGPFLVCYEGANWKDFSFEKRASLISRQGLPGMHAVNGLYVVDPVTGFEVPRDGRTVGEIALKGNTVAIGYYKNEEATRKQFREGKFWTGDLAVVHSDGYVQLVDRVKDLVHVNTSYGWENVSSIEIEQVILESKQAKDVAVVGYQTKAGDHEIAAIVEPADSRSQWKEALLSYCLENLPKHKIPSLIIKSVIPKTATGKVQKALIREALPNFSKDEYGTSSPVEEAAV